MEDGHTAAHERARTYHNQEEAMSATLTVGDLMIEVVNRRSDGKVFAFVDFDPRGVPGYTSNIAEVYGCSEHQTQHLLDAVDELKDMPHFIVDPYGMRPCVCGEDGEVIVPAEIRVTVIPD
ncbi:MAG TPA: hypothetical protein VN081_02905 [Dongiaceae bacterium]|nr:hypothetical protein [Dongiaceae bacterium]